MSGGRAISGTNAGDSRNDLSGSSGHDARAGSVTGDIPFHRDLPDRHGPPPGQLPAGIDGFVGRTDELGLLDAALTDRDGGRAVVSVHVVAGTAGAGKTSLALHWAHRAKDRFPDGQLFVNLRGYDPGEPVTPEQALRGFLRALGVPAAQVPGDAETAAALYRALLAERRVLVLLDDAASATQVRPLLPGAGESMVLVTSRSRLSGLAVRDSARRVTLGTLPEPEAVALLQAVTSGRRTDDDLDSLAELARLCARLPLALRIAAERAAGRPHLRTAELTAELRDGSALRDAPGSGGEDEADAVLTVFAWAYRALPPPAARLFRLLGLHPVADFGPHPAAALADLPVSGARRLLDDLAAAHLLERTAPDRYHFHDLLRAYAADRARTEEPPEERDAALRRVLDWYLHTADAAQTWIKPAEDHLPLPDPVGSVPPQAFADHGAAADWAEREHLTFPALVRAAVAAGLDAHATSMAELAWRAMAPSAARADWIDPGHAGLEAAERSDDPYAQLRLLTVLGTIHRETNRFEAGLECLRRALEVARRTGRRFDEARVLNTIGLIHLRRRQLDLAGTHFAEAAAILEELDDRRLAAAVHANVAAVSHKAGRLPEAATALDQALAINRAADDRRGLGNALRLLAVLQLESGQADTALRSAQEALEIALTLHSDTLEAYWLIALGDTQRATAAHEEALTSYQRSAALHRRLGDRGREALAWRGAGLTYTAMERPGEAADFHRQAAAVHQELGDAWEHAVELDHLAAVLHPKDPAVARGYWTRALTHLTPYTDPRAEGVRARIERQLAQ
ncbi:ATP-binding protein [Streptomyces sp. IBSBF 2435]|uniref:ATP-binding protein n=1 Tax=Streptomyces sp. IBSBF 2435 TaxID=2903531 RepID=UPI002FDC0201